MKLFCIPLLFILFAHLSYAQNYQLGVRTGINLSTLAGNSPGDITGKAGYHLGISGSRKLDDLISFSTELNYNRQGRNGDSGKTSLHYLSVPLLASVERKGFFIKGGVQLSYLLSAVHFASNSVIGEGIQQEIDPIDISLSLGGGVVLLNDFTLEVRYLHGFNNLTHYDPMSVLREEELMNRVLQFSIGYFLFSQATVE